MPDARIALTTSVFLLSLVISGTVNTALAQAGPVNSSEPVLKAPFSAHRLFTEIKNAPGGKTNQLQSGGSLARDSKGLIYSAGERHWTYFDGQKDILKSEILYRIHDPLTNTDTQWDSTTREVKVIHWPRNPSQADTATSALYAAFGGEVLDDTQPGINVEKLGTKIVAGVVAEGTQTSYTVSAKGGDNDKPIVVTHEKWYCPELKIVVLDINDDPRSGHTRDELTNITRVEPDLNQYHYPPDYHVREVRLPQ